MTPDEEYRFFAQIIGDAKRTIICEVPRVDEIREAVNRADLAGILTVQASPSCPPGQLLVVDERALDAAADQAASRPIRPHGR